MKYDAQKEIEVFGAVKELGEATETEIMEMLKKNKVQIKQDELRRYIRRWKAKKIFALNSVNGEWVAKLADIPAWFSSGIMAICKGTNSEEMQIAIDSLNEKLKKEGRIIEPRSVWGGYKTYTMTFECLTAILGGRLSDDERELKFPRNNGKLIIPSNWMTGTFRDNASLMDLPSSIAYHIAVGNGEFITQPETQKIQLKVKTGLVVYEAVPAGSKFKTIIRFPLGRGSTLKTKEQIVQWFRMIEEASLRGLGANPRALGGRMKLVSMVEA